MQDGDKISKSDDADARRRSDLAAFLRAMRERISPESVGIAPGSRRRTKGLRREEVAARAAISATWYVWLEQGRPVTPSLRVVDSLARALQLSSTERSHLLQLARPMQMQTAAMTPQPPSEALLALLHGLAPQPGYILDPLWNAVAWNEPAERTFGAFSGDEIWKRNVLMRIFLDEHWRGLFQGWNELARSAVAQFRAATAGLQQYQEFQDMVATMQTASPEFGQHWQNMEVAEPQSWRKSISHESMGQINFNTATFPCTGPDRGFWITIYTPVSAPDRQKMERSCDV